VVSGADSDGEVAWERLWHAYGLAVDTPGHLRGLADPDPEVRGRAIAHLHGHVFHQGTIFPATAPAVAAVCRLLADESTAWLPVRGLWPPLEERPPGPLCAQLLLFLAAVAESASEGGTGEQLAARQCSPGLEAELLARVTARDWSDGDIGGEPWYTVADAVLAGAVLACREQAPAALQAAQRWLGAPQRQVWQAAAAAQARWARLRGDPALIATVTGRITAEASRAKDAPDRAAWVLALRDLGADTSAFLGDGAQVVRVCAALSDSVTADPRSLREILAALAALPGSELWLPAGGYPFIKGLFRFTLIEAAIARAESFDQLLPAALWVAAHISHPYAVAFDWGPLLCAAFPTPPVPGTPLPEAPRRYLRALADNDDLWDTMIANGTLYLRKLGLPTDREGIRQLAEGHNDPPHRRSD
jgi:hypothetical protein